MVLLFRTLGLNVCSNLYQVLFSYADDGLPSLTTVVASDDGNETETASPEQSYEVEEIFSDPTIETEPAMSESNEVVKLRIRATSETEPTMPKLTEDFEPVEATTQATNEHCELLGFLSLCLLVCFSMWFPFCFLTVLETYFYFIFPIFKVQVNQLLSGSMMCF